MAKAGTGPRTLARLARGWLPDRNPLRRTSDRIESVLLAVLLAGFLAVAPAAGLAAGQWAAAAHGPGDRGPAAVHHVPAVLLQAAPAPARGLFQAPGEQLARARWTAPDGTARTGLVQVPAGSPAGRTVMVGTDAGGRLAAVPEPGYYRAIRAGLAAVLAVIAVGLVLTGAGLAGRRLLQRRRLAAWDLNWSATGPQWTGRR